MSFEIRPLSDALGAEVTGLDLSRPMDDETFARVHGAHLDHHVVVFRDQQLSPEAQIAFSRRFGPLDQHPADDATLAGHPEILLVSTKKENGNYIGLPDAGPMWHSDLAYMERTSLGTMLYGVEIPDAGGDTGFANMHRAYETLPPGLKAKVDGKRGVFLAGRNNAKRSFRRRYTEAQQEKTPAVTHPICRTHPENGRKSVFANPQHTIAIEGMSEAESDAVLEELFEHCARPEFAYYHRWRAGDLVFWDNRSVWHIADHSRLDDPTYIRHLHRTTIEGDAPF